MVFGEMGLSTIIDIVASLGFDGFEADVPDIEKIYGSPKKFMNALRQKDLALAASYLGADYHDATQHPRIEQEALRWAEFLAGAESGNIVIGPPSRFSGLTEKHIKNMAQILNTIGKKTLDFNVRIGVHNHYGSIVESRQEIDLLMKFTDAEYVGFAPDTGHLAISGCHVQQTFKDYADRINYIHLKDAIHPEEFAPREEGFDKSARRGVQWVDRFRDPGKGEIDFAPLMRILKSVGYDGWITYEQDFSSNPKESARIAKEYIDLRIAPIFEK